MAVRLPLTGATHYHAQLGLPNKGYAIKELVVCNSWDLDFWDLINGLALCCYQPSPEVWIVKKNTVPHPRERQRDKYRVLISYWIYPSLFFFRTLFYILEEERDKSVAHISCIWWEHIGHITIIQMYSQFESSLSLSLLYLSLSLTLSFSPH